MKVLAGVKCAMLNEQKRMKTEDYYFLNKILKFT